MSPRKKGSAVTAYEPKKIEYKKIEYTRTLTIGDNTIGFMYPALARSENTDNAKSYRDYYPPVPRPLPNPGWKESLDGAITDLKDPEHSIGDILRYLPSGTVVVYPSMESTNGVSYELPKEVGLYSFVKGSSLDKVVSIVELWLRRKAERNNTKPL